MSPKGYNCGPWRIILSSIPINCIQLFGEYILILNRTKNSPAIVSDMYYKINEMKKGPLSLTFRLGLPSLTYR